jgi:hypothetical protein
MGARITFGLIIVAAATLIAGVVTHTAWVIYLSIGCSVLAAIGLLLSSRRARARAKAGADEHMAWTASLAEPAATEATARILPGPAAAHEDDDDRTEAMSFFRRVSSRSAATASPGAAGSDEPDGPTGETAVAVADAPPTASGRGPSRRRDKRNAAVSDWVAPAPAAVTPGRAPATGPGDGEAVGAVSTPRAAPAPAPRRSSATGPARTVAPRPAAAAPAPASRRPTAPAPASSPAAASSRAPATGADEYPFPIEDYDFLDEEDILPLLPHLYDEELVEVFLRERAGANRVAILERLDALMEGEA